MLSHKPILLNRGGTLSDAGGPSTFTSALARRENAKASTLAEHGI